MTVGTPQCKAWAVLKPGGDVVDFSYTPKPLEREEVEIAVDACGVCHSDLHQQQNDWKIGNYPMVVGHEIIGRITALGPAVSGVKLGQRVGVGPQCGSCEQCNECQTGVPQLCTQRIDIYNSPTGTPEQPHTYGGFSESVRCNYKWVFPIPDGLDSVDAAPIMCAGLTTWAPFQRHNVQRGDAVGIIGIGGLGHMAIQFASALGFETTAISTSANKREEAVKLGAKHFLNVKDTDQMKKTAATFDFMLMTVPAENFDWATYLNLLKPQGKMCIVGVTNMITIPSFALVARNITVVGSLLAPPSEIRRMLQFAADHKIHAMTESLPMNANNCNAALKKVAANSVRYRMVLVNNH
uniref:Enoyl reductase (ER) domain-containing protein n=1 Tax=Spongospora subterranea TaxID=70186 RepID=A0A0H5RDM0_9EUKA|eukprot:CRZ11662.1 hypothetical protein [Spongospora subterranea]